MGKEWKFEPDPTTRAYINYLDTAPIKFDELNYQLEHLSEIEKKRKLSDTERVVKINIEILIK
jgi:hypothetical protein